MRAKVEKVADHHFKFSVRGMDGDIDVQMDPKIKSLGPSPKELVLAALCGCTGTDVIDLMAKFQVNYDKLSLEARASLTDHHPKVFKQIDLSYYVQGTDIAVEKVVEAVKRSTHQYSGTAAMLAKNNPIFYKVYVNETAVAEGEARFES